MAIALCARVTSKRPSNRLRATPSGTLRGNIQGRLGISDRKYFRTEFLAPAMQAGLLEMTDPDKLRSSKQRYRLTATGKALADQLARRHHGEPDE
ncbi:MAG TPA: hypothetical protein VF331_17965 [Polyangiales bacterium]